MCSISIHGVSYLHMLYRSRGILPQIQLQLFGYPVSQSLNMVCPTTERRTVQEPWQPARLYLVHAQLPHTQTHTPRTLYVALTEICRRHSPRSAGKWRDFKRPIEGRVSMASAHPIYMYMCSHVLQMDTVLRQNKITTQTRSNNIINCHINTQFINE